MDFFNLNNNKLGGQQCMNCSELQELLNNYLTDLHEQRSKNIKQDKVIKKLLQETDVLKLQIQTQ